MANFLNVADTYGRGRADAQSEQINALNMDAARSRMKSEKQQYDASQKRQNTEWLAGATRFALENPAAVPQLVQEGKSRGIFGPDLTPENVTPAELEEVYQSAIVALGGSGPEPKGTSGMQEYQFARSQGFQGSFQDWKKTTKSAGVNINNIPSPAAGYQNVFDDQGQLLRQDPIPGGPADQKLTEAQEMESLKATQASNAASLGAEDIDRAILTMLTGTLPDTGWGDVLKHIPGTDAKKLEGLLSTVQAKVGFGELQAMRDSSPTGGALGQVSEREINFLQALQGSLDQSQSKHVLIYNLNRLWNGYQDVIHGPDGGPERRLLSENQIKNLLAQKQSPEAIVNSFTTADAGSGLPVVVTDQDYDALPQGTRFVDENGQEYIKN